MNLQTILLTFQQEQVWFLRKLVPKTRAYNFQFSIRFTGKLDRLLLEKSVTEIIRRHEILRTTFTEVAGRPVQVIHEPWEAHIPEIDLRDLPEGEREARAEERIGEVLLHVFDVAELPLFRIVLYRLGDEEYLYVSRQPRSPVSEAFRSLRVNLEFAGAAKPLRTILVTSPGPGEGKTTVSANLAAIIAQGGKTSLLVDADLRRPRVHKVLGIPNRIGLSDLFRDLYVSLGEPLDGRNSWSVRLYFKPFIRWIWLGAIFMSLGAILGAMDPRYRLAARARAEPLAGVTARAG